MTNSKTASVFIPSEHLFYDDLVTMLMALSSYMFTINAFNLSNNPVEFSQRSLQEWMSYIRPIRDFSWPFSLDVRSVGSSLVFLSAEIVMAISLNSWPQFIEYRMEQKNKEFEGYSITSTGNRKIITRIVGSSFISFYEGYKDNFKAKYGDIQYWPDTLNFARHIRNGFAHGGNFYITDPNVSVNWKIWNIDYTYNGKPVLFSPYEIGVGDLVFLMQDVNDLIK